MNSSNIITPKDTNLVQLGDVSTSYLLGEPQSEKWFEYAPTIARSFGYSGLKN